MDMRLGCRWISARFLQPHQTASACDSIQKWPNFSHQKNRTGPNYNYCCEDSFLFLCLSQFWLSIDHLKSQGLILNPHLREHCLHFAWRIFWAVTRIDPLASDSRLGYLCGRVTLSNHLRFCSLRGNLSLTGYVIGLMKRLFCCFLPSSSQCALSAFKHLFSLQSWMSYPASSSIRK